MGVDLFEPFGGDISFAPQQDVGFIGGSSSDFDFLVDRDELIQRLLRRLFTAPGEWIPFPNYGAGVRGLVNEPLSSQLALQIRATITSQVLQEPDVARQPAPVVRVESVLNGVQVFVQLFTVAQVPVSFSFNPANPDIFSTPPAVISVPATS